MTDEQEPRLPVPAPEVGPPAIDADEFIASFGESLSQTLDLDTWQPGENLPALYGRLEREIEEAVRQESGFRERIRQEIFPRLAERPGAPQDAGVYAARPEDVEKVHLGLLFNGS